MVKNAVSYSKAFAKRILHLLLDSILFFFCYSSATRCFSEETQSFLLFSQISQIQLDQFRNASIVTETFPFNMYYFSILEPYFASYNFQRVDSFDDWIYKNLAWNVK